MRKHILIALAVMLLLLAGCAAGSAAATQAIPTTTPRALLVSPADLKLSGRIIFTGSATSIDAYDLSTNKIVPLYTTPRNGFVTGEAVSPGGKQVVFSYAPPPKGSAQLGYSDLYQMPLDQPAAPAPLLQGSPNHEVYSYPSWSPNGKYLYYGHTLPPEDTGGQSQGPRIERIVYPDGKPEVLQKGASYPRLSPDGSKLVYITFQPDLSGNEIFVANADGSDAVRLVSQTDFVAIDSPIFSPDGKYVIFSAVSNPPASRGSGILAGWFGLSVAWAHNIPSDLWRVPVGGGKSERLTNVGCTGLFAGFSPDSRYLAFMCDAGFFVTNPDGTNLRALNTDGGLGTMEWIP